EIAAMPWPADYVSQKGAEAAQAELQRHNNLLAKNDQNSRQMVQARVEEARRRAMAKAIHEILIAMLRVADPIIIRQVYVHETI
ncbi:MAG: hypothetical protein ACP5GS_08585, partial [Nitrososphaeria archaeon]